MKHLCVAYPKDANARLEGAALLDSNASPSNAADALLGRNPQGRRGLLRVLHLIPRRRNMRYIMLEALLGVEHGFS